MSSIKSIEIMSWLDDYFFFFFQAEDGIRDGRVTGVQTCALPIYHRRHGGQSQFAASVDLAPENDRIAAAIGYARDHIAEGLTVERLAEEIGMSLRQFSRAFRAQTGTTPARVVERLRADLARGRIETTAEPVERIAEAVGFGDAENMRRAFIRIYGQPPQSIRRAIKS